MVTYGPARLAYLKIKYTDKLVSIYHWTLIKLIKNKNGFFLWLVDLYVFIFFFIYFKFSIYWIVITLVN